MSKKRLRVIRTPVKPPCLLVHQENKASSSSSCQVHRVVEHLLRSLFITKTIGISVSASVESKLELGGSVGTRCQWRTNTRDSCC